MMRLLNGLIDSGRKARQRALASQIAQQSHELVWQRVQRRAVSMSQSEARGYIRAWSTDAIRDGIEQVLPTEGSNLDHTVVMTLATEEVIRSVLKRVLNARPVWPALRRAA